MTGLLHAGTLIVGGGPAGLAPLLAASQRSMLSGLLDRGVIIAGSAERIGPGRIGRHITTSDSSADSFLSCVRDNPEPALAAVAASPEAQAVASFGQGAVPLALVARFMETLGDAVNTLIQSSPLGHVLTGHRALSTRLLPDAGWLTRLRCDKTGEIVEIVSRQVLIATGGHQPEARLRQERIAGRPLLPRYRNTLIQSDTALAAEGHALIERRLAGVERPRIAIVGGSSSALACANSLLRNVGPRLQPGAITLMHRRQLAVFYPSAQAARADNYTEFGPGDICPVTGFVFRFGGLRFDAGELVMQLRGIAGRPPENRVTVQRFGRGAAASDSRRTLDEAHLVIACLGYRPIGLPVLDATGQPIALLADQPGGALVSRRSGVLDATGSELPGLYGMGLAAGLVASGSMGGEPSFRGQMNSLWLWQNDAGAFLARRLLDHGA